MGWSREKDGEGRYNKAMGDWVVVGDFCSVLVRLSQAVAGRGELSTESNGAAKITSGAAQGKREQASKHTHADRRPLRCSGQQKRERDKSFRENKALLLATNPLWDAYGITVSITLHLSDGHADRERGG